MNHHNLTKGDVLLLAHWVEKELSDFGASCQLVCISQARLAYAFSTHQDPGPLIKKFYGREEVLGIDFKHESETTYTVELVLDEEAVV